MDALRDVGLDPQAQAALELVVERNVDALVQAAARAVWSEPVWALALLYTDDQEELEPAAVRLAPDSVRRQVVATTAPKQLYWSIWDVMQWPKELDLEFPSEEPDFAAANDHLLAALGQSDVNPVRWALARVARAMGTTTVPMPTAPDFAVTPVDLAAADEITTNLLFSTTPAVVEVLDANGLLRPRAEALDRGRATAFLEEVIDDVAPRFCAVYDCALEHDGDSVAGPSSVLLTDALAWARARADRVELAVGDERYSAGSEAIGGLPPWPNTAPPGPRPIE